MKKMAEKYQDNNNDETSSRASTTSPSSSPSSSPTHLLQYFNPMLPMLFNTPFNMLLNPSPLDLSRSQEQNDNDEIDVVGEDVGAWDVDRVGRFVASLPDCEQYQQVS